jgi:orotate phosphoribosyltransferase
MSDVESFKQNIIDCGYVLDQAGTHSEFVSGMHGRKLDFDNLDQKSDPLYHEWIDVQQEFITKTFSKVPKFILGVANGTNRVAYSLGERFKGQTIPFASRKNEKASKEIYLPELAKTALWAMRPSLVLVVEDVGTTGSNSVQVARQALESGADEAIVVTTWKRRANLERLDEASIEYLAIIDDPLPTFTPEDCVSDPSGFCARQWEFKPRS